MFLHHYASYCDEGFVTEIIYGKDTNSPPPFTAGGGVVLHSLRDTEFFIAFSGLQNDAEIYKWMSL